MKSALSTATAAPRVVPRTRAVPRATRRVLLLPLEFIPWHRARPWTYAAQLALEEGFAAQGIEVMTLPALCEVPSSARGSWLSRFDRIVGREKFDQVWIWLCHPEYDDKLMDRLTRLAPVRVGVLMESLQYTVRERKAHPYFHDYQPTVVRQSRCLTHIVAADEVDAVDLGTLTSAQTLWWPGTVPGRLLAEIPQTLPQAPAAFFGAIYGDRARWFANRRLRRLLVRPPSPDDASACPTLFDRLFLNAHEYLDSGGSATRAELDEFVVAWRAVRRKAFETYLAGLRPWSAVVALPSYVKTYAGRVVEGMAVGRPVVSWNIPRRPRNRALFVDGEEILLYPHHDPEALAGILRRLKNDPAWGRRIAAAGQAKVRRYHTIEARVAQVLDWIEHDREPDFGEGAPAHLPARLRLVASQGATSRAATDNNAVALPAPRVVAGWIRRVLATAPSSARSRRSVTRIRRVLVAGAPRAWHAELRRLSPDATRRSAARHRWRTRLLDSHPARRRPTNADLLLWSTPVPSQSGDAIAELAVTLHNLVAPGGRVVLLNSCPEDAVRQTLHRLGFRTLPLGGTLTGRVLQRDSMRERTATAAPTSPASLRYQAVRTTIVHPSIAMTTTENVVVVVHEWNRRLAQVQAVRATHTLVCWGTGARARALAELLKSVGLEFDACVDGDATKAGSRFNALVVQPPGWLREQITNGERVFVVIASMFVSAISKRLKRLEVKPADYLAL